MGSESHRIDAAVFDVSFPKEEKGSDLASHLTSVVRTRALPVVERVLDDLVPADRMVVVEELELDLGELPWSAWPEVLPRRLEEELRSALAGLGELDPWRPSPGVRSVTREESDREILRSYLRSGRLPWRRATMDVDEMDALLDRMVRTRPRELLQLLRTVEPAAPALRRLVEQLPEGTIAHLLGTLPVADAGRLGEARRRIRALLDRHVPTQDGRQAMERAFLVALLGATVTRPAGSPARTVLAGAVQATPWGSEELAQAAARTVMVEVGRPEHPGGVPAQPRGPVLASGNGSDGARSVRGSRGTASHPDETLVEERTGTSAGDRRVDGAASAERLVGRRLRDLLRRRDPATPGALWARWIREHPDRVRRELREAVADPPVLARVARLFPDWWLEDAVRLLARLQADPVGGPTSTTLPGFVRWLSAVVREFDGSSGPVGGATATPSGTRVARDVAPAGHPAPDTSAAQAGRSAGRGHPPRAAALYEAALRYLAGSSTGSEVEPSAPHGGSWPLQLIQADAGRAGRSVEEHLRHLEHLAGAAAAEREAGEDPTVEVDLSTTQPARPGVGTPDLPHSAAILELLDQARSELHGTQVPVSDRPYGASEPGAAESGIDGRSGSAEPGGAAESAGSQDATFQPPKPADDTTSELVEADSGGPESHSPTDLLLRALRDGSPGDAETTWARVEARDRAEAVAALARVLSIRSVRRRVAESAAPALTQDWVTALAGGDLVPARLLASIEGLPDTWMGTGAASPEDLTRLVVREEALATLAGAPGASEDAAAGSPHPRNTVLAARLLSARARASGLDPATTFQAVRASLESAASLAEPRATLLRHMNEAPPTTPAPTAGDAYDARSGPRSVHEAVLEDAVLGGPVDTLVAVWRRLRAEAPEVIRQVFARHASSRWVLRSVVDRFPPALLLQLLRVLGFRPDRAGPPAAPRPHPAYSLPSERLRWADGWVQALQEAVAPARSAAGVSPVDPDERASLVQMYESADRVRRALVPPTGSEAVASGTLAALLPALVEEQPGQVLRLLRAVEEGGDTPAGWGDGLSADDLRHLVDAYLVLRLPGAIRLRDAIPGALARATDPPGFVARLLRALLAGATVDLEELAQPAPERAEPANASTSSPSRAGDGTIDLVAGDRVAGDLRRGRPESLADAVVRAARGWDDPGPVRAELTRMLEAISSPSEPLRRLVDDPEVRPALARVLPEHLLARMILLLRPGAYAHARLAGDLVEEVVRDAGMDASPERVSTLRWQATLEVLLTREGVFRPKEFLSMLLPEVADRLQQPSAPLFRALTHRLTGPAPAHPALADPAHLQALVSGPGDAATSPDATSFAGGFLDTTSSDQEPRSRDGNDAEAPEEDLDSDTDLLVANAGLVLAAPFLPRLFSMLGLLEDRAFRSRTAATRGVQLLHLLATGSTDAPEFLLLLPKLLCGLPLESPVPRRLEATPEETEAVDQLLEGMIQHWDALGQASPEGLRETFLQREGWLHRGDDRWDLGVELRGVDVLLDRVPWTFRTVALPWMPDVLHVDWR